MATYTIKLLNQSGFTKSYAVYPKPPMIEGPGPMTVWSNAWAAFGMVVSGAFVQLEWTDTFQACCSIGQPSPNSIINTLETADVDPAAGNAVTFAATPAPGFAGDVQSGIAPPGAFDLITAADFDAGNNFFLGLAQPSNGVSVQVATFRAEPNETFTLYPTNGVFYVQNGTYVPGQPVTVPPVPSQRAQVDFTGRPETTAVVVQNGDGSWTVSYE